jgi:hypothetical protein
MRILAGFDTAEHGTLTFEGRGTTGSGSYVSTDVTAGTYCAETMAAISGASGYTAFATAVATAMTASMGSTVTGSWSSSNLQYTFSKTGAGDWKIGADEADADIARLGRFCGFSTSLTNATSITSDVTPYFAIETAIDEKSNVSDTYEPDGIVSEAEADDGSSYTIARSTAPQYEDFRFVYESHAATFTREASASVPYTFQRFIEDVRAAHPFWVRNASDSAVYTMRAKAAVFAPTRVTKDFDDHWNWPFQCRLIGRP